MNSDISDPMDPSLLQLERELQSLTPVAPGREFMRTLQARMEPVPKVVPFNKAHVSPWRRMVAPAAAAAAAVAVMSVHNHRRQTVAIDSPVADESDSVPPAIKWEPMPMRSEFRAMLEQGLVFNENYEPVQQLLMNRVDHHEWRNAADNSSVRLTIPRQQRFIVPAGYDSEQPSPGRRRLQFQ